MALVLVMEVGTVVIKVAICPCIFLLGTVQVVAEQTFLYITKIPSWRFKQPQLSQLLDSYQNHSLGG